jgi:site-specific DNA recombinase
MAIDDTKIKFIAYSRKSTEGKERQALSLGDQKKKIEGMVSSERLTVVASFLGDAKGESQSAHKRGRPIFNKCIELIESGAANGLLVWHPNRLSRNPIDSGLLIGLMDEGKLIAIKTPNRVYRNNSEDKRALGNLFVDSKGSSDDNSEVAKRGLETKVKAGWKPGLAPVGYLNTKYYEEKGKNTVVKDEARFEIVRNMWQMMLTGNHSVMRVFDKACGDWNLRIRTSRHNPTGKYLSRSALYRVFNNPFYYGYFEYGTGADGKKLLHQGSHEPMITEDEFWRVQALLGKKGRPRDKHKSFPFTGTMRCGGCDAAITAEEKIKRYKNGTVQHFIYYRCTKRVDKNCPEKYVESKELVTQIDTLLAQLEISDALQAWALKYMHEMRKSEGHVKISAIESKQRELVRIDKQLVSPPLLRHIDRHFIETVFK